jgi:phospholipid/cholesterol/gamma-HCH transport system substrate-binding protein
MCVTGCGFHGIYSLPLPGAVGTGSHTYTINVEFADVLDLVPYSAVKVNGATMGHIKSISLVDGHANVVCQIEDAAHLPRNAVAKVSETSLLGEKYVELEPPSAVPPQGRLVSGDTIALTSTQTDASVEEVLGALSALLNGGGVAQIDTIAREVNTALHGRTGVARDLLVQMRSFAGGLDAQKAQIVRAIQGVDNLSRTVKAQEGELVSAIEKIPPALHVLAVDRRQLTTMLESVSHLGKVAVRVENASQRDLIANLRALRPTLGKLAKVGQVIPKTLSILITYPTADSVEKEYFGDYGNLSLTIDLSGDSLKRLLEGSQLTLPTNSASSRTSTGKHAGHHKKHKKQPPKKKVTINVPGLGPVTVPPTGAVTQWAPGSSIGSLLGVGHK